MHKQRQKEGYKRPEIHIKAFTLSLKGSRGKSHEGCGGQRRATQATTSIRAPAAATAMRPQGSEERTNQPVATVSQASEVLVGSQMHLGSGDRLLALRGGVERSDTCVL